MSGILLMMMKMITSLNGANEKNLSGLKNYITVAWEKCMKYSKQNNFHFLLVLKYINLATTYHIVYSKLFILDTYFIFGSISNSQRSPSICGSTQHVISGHYCHIIVNFVYKTKAWGEITLLKLDIWPSQFSGAGHRRVGGGGWVFQVSRYW